MGVMCRDFGGTSAMERAESMPRNVTPALLRRGAAIIQDMSVIIAESVAESYLADAGLARGGEHVSFAFLQQSHA